MIRILNENKQIAAISMTVEVEKPINVKAKANEENAVIIGPRLLNLDTNQPEMGKPIKELMGINNKSVPNSASLNWKLILMVGMREAHVEKQTPERKKNTLKKIRCFILVSICQKFQELNFRTGNNIKFQCKINGGKYYCLKFQRNVAP